MITHYLKVALRNLLKYKTQTVISVLGLAVGFVCFALSAFWIKYEMTFDTFHEDADRIHLVTTNDEVATGIYSCYTPPALANYLKSTYNEVEEAVCYEDWPTYVQCDSRMENIETLGIDSTFMDMMNIEVLEGSTQFLIPAKENNEIAITRSGALHLFGTTHVIGKTLINASRKIEYRIGAIVSEWGEHSTMRYKLLKARSSNANWENSNFKTLVKVKEGTDMEAWKDKINLNFPQELKSNKFFPNTGLTHFIVKPLSETRHAPELKIQSTSIISLRYIIYFSIVGLLIIVCSLVNYLTLFIDRCRTRQRELALRKVNGASEASLHLLLANEFMITLLISLCLGMAFIELLLPTFSRYTDIIQTEIPIYKECLLYLVAISISALPIILITILFFRRQSLHHAIQSRQGSQAERFFRKATIVLQLTVSLSFIFCTSIIQKQLQHLRHSEVGFEYAGRGAVSIWLNVDMNVWAEKIKALPMVTEVVEPKYWPLIGQSFSSSRTIDSWDGLDTALETPMTLHTIRAGKDFFEFYDMQLLAGEWINKDTQAYHINIMESTARKMGWTPEEAIGKHIYHTNKNVSPLTVIGVVKDCAFTSPTNDLIDVEFTNTYLNPWSWERGFVLFKFQPGTWEKCRKMIEEMQQAELPDRKLFLYNEEEEFNKFLKAEDSLSQLLGFASMVCILISIFGIYSLVTLTCEQRRKEIAIRKVNGATIKDIFSMFFKEYLLLLGIASLIAFPTSYAIMKQWLETYNRQTEIGWIPFIGIFLVIAMVVILSISWRVWKAANENPADVVKSE